MHFGARIGYSGSRSHFVAQNLHSALTCPSKVAQYLSEECAAGRMAGPYQSLPHPQLRCSGVGVVPKKSGKLRLIMHLSAPEGRSINDGICADEFSLHYVSIDDAVRVVQKHGRGALMAKVDIKNAFRLCPVAPADWPLLGIRWDNAYYVDKFLPFGLRSSPFLFNRLAEALCWILQHKFDIVDLMHYLDDFLSVQPAHPPSVASVRFRTMLAALESLQVPLAEGPDKVCPPSTTITFLGIELDSVQWEMRLPSTKLAELKTALDGWTKMDHCTKRELLSLAGSLSFAAKVVPPGRTFCRRLFDAAGALSDLDEVVPLSGEARDDIAWWHACIEAWNGRSLLIDAVWRKPADVDLYTDASNLGYGLVYGTQWTYGTWDQAQQLRSIEWRELFPIALIPLALGAQLANQRLLVHCDNESVCFIWKSGTSKCPHIMALVRAALLAAAKHNMIIYVTHIRGIDNSRADSLSRLQVDTFKAQYPAAAKQPLVVDWDRLHRLTAAPWSSSVQEWRHLRPAPTPPV